MKRIALLICMIALAGGCGSFRLSARYGDGISYDGIGSVKTNRKFFIRSIRIDRNYEAWVTPGKISSMVPELIAKSEKEGNIPLDVVVTMGDRVSSGGWSFLLYLCSYGVVPFWNINESVVKIDIADRMGDVVASGSECVFHFSSKVSCCSPFGLLTREKEGFQKNLIKRGTLFSLPRISSDEHVECFASVVAECIACEIKRYALERLTLPDVYFAQEGI